MKTLIENAILNSSPKPRYIIIDHHSFDPGKLGLSVFKRTNPLPMNIPHSSFGYRYVYEQDVNGASMNMFCEALPSRWNLNPFLVELYDMSGKFYGIYMDDASHYTNRLHPIMHMLPRDMLLKGWKDNLARRFNDKKSNS